MISFDQLRRGTSSKDWEEARLSGLAQQLEAEARMIHALEIPEGWTGWTVCSHCGPRPATPGYVGDEVDSCAWCEVTKRVKEHVDSADSRYEASSRKFWDAYARADASLGPPRRDEE